MGKRALRRWRRYRAIAHGRLFAWLLCRPGVSPPALWRGCRGAENCRRRRRFYLLWGGCSRVGKIRDAACALQGGEDWSGCSGRWCRGSGLSAGCNRRSRLQRWICRFRSHPGIPGKWVFSIFRCNCRDACRAGRWRTGADARDRALCSIGGAWWRGSGGGAGGYAFLWFCHAGCAWCLPKGALRKDGRMKGRPLPSWEWYDRCILICNRGNRSGAWGLWVINQSTASRWHKNKSGDN